MALIESFRDYGIYPRDVRSLLEDGLRWWEPQNTDLRFGHPKGPLRLARDKKLHTGPFKDRKSEWEAMRQNAEMIQQYLDQLRGKKCRDWAWELYLLMGPGGPASVHRDRDGRAELVVESVRLAARQAARGPVKRELVVEIAQRRRGYLEPEKQETADRGEIAADDEGDFTFRGGCTLIVDAESGRVRYAISKSLLSSRRLERTRRFFATKERRQEGSLRATYFGAASSPAEPFAVLHRAFGKEPL